MNQDNVSLWGLAGLGPWEVAKRTARGFRTHHLDARSAQFAYYSMLVIAPLLILVIAAVSRLPVEGVIDSFLEGTGRTLPSGANEVLVRQIRDIELHSTIALAAIALVVLVFAGSKLFFTVSRGLNATLAVREDRRFLVVHGLALLCTLGAFLVMLLALLLLLLGPLIGEFVESVLHLPVIGQALGRGTRWMIVAVVLLLSLSIVYWLAPSVRLRWWLFTPGSVFATFAWIGVSFGFQFYAARFATYNQTYGALGGVIALLIWLYLTGTVIFTGGQINSVVYTELSAQRSRASHRSLAG